MEVDSDSTSNSNTLTVTDNKTRRRSRVSRGRRSSVFLAPELNQCDTETEDKQPRTSKAQRKLNQRYEHLKREIELHNKHLQKLTDEHEGWNAIINQYQTQLKQLQSQGTAGCISVDRLRVHQQTFIADAPDYVRMLEGCQRNCNAINDKVQSTTDALRRQTAAKQQDAERMRTHKVQLVADLLGPATVDELLMQLPPPPQQASA